MLKKPSTYLGLFLFIAGTASIMGKTLTVGQANTPCPNAKYSTIGAAVSAAKPGDRIDICPATYPEQLIISKPLTLSGIWVNGTNRVLIQPTLNDLESLATEAVITVLNTGGVRIENLALDASKNSVAGCSPGVAGVHFFNSSGAVTDSAIFNAHLANPLSCTTLPFGNGFGVIADSDLPGPFTVEVARNSIHDYTANGVQVNGAGIIAFICDNTISGVGPASGIFQFAIFILNGAVADIHHNVITEGVCGSVPTLDCISMRSEGVTLRAIGDGTVVRDNVIMNAQSGIFINGANKLRVTHNQIGNIYGLSGIDIQATASGYFTNNVINGNVIFNVGGVSDPDAESCGIDEAYGTGTYSGNFISHNIVSDAYCGVAYAQPDTVASGSYFNTLYTALNSSLTSPPAVEP